jgi:hypothetical protein
VPSKNIENHANELSKCEILLQSYIDYWIPVLGLGSWSRITSTCHPDSHPVNSGTLGEAAVNWRYMEADINFYLGCMLGLDAKRIEYIVVHELCHCLVNEMRDENSEEDHQHKYLIPHEERVVCNLAMAFLRLKYKKGKK